ncbi:hypothetical protein [Emcibacter sp.]|uniref:hypothetical protein n=1 Tax=Emcibacter sp. TaxID=1979954 RepID=UPI003A8CC971
MCVRLKSLPLFRALTLCVVSAFFMLPAAVQAGEKQEKMKSEMEKSKTEMEKAAEEIQGVDPAAGPVDEVEPKVYDKKDVMKAPETKAVHKKATKEKVVDPESPE